MQSEAIRDELLKVDRRGHVLVKRKRREALLDEFARCGVSAAEFAAQIGVNYQTFGTGGNGGKNRQRTLVVQAAAPVSAALMAPQLEPSAHWVEAVVEAEGSHHERAMNVVISLPALALDDSFESRQSSCRFL